MMRRRPSKKCSGEHSLRRSRSALGLNLQVRDATLQWTLPDNSIESLQGLECERIPVVPSPDRICPAEDAGRFFFKPHARCRGCGTGRGARVGLFTARAHWVMHECIFFTQIVVTETSYLSTVFAHPLLFLQLRKMQNSLPLHACDSSHG